MKNWIVLFTFLISLCIPVTAQEGSGTSAHPDSLQTDTTVISTILADEEKKESLTVSLYADTDWEDNNPPVIIILTAIIMGCGLPLFIIILLLYFRYKNKQAQYRLAAEALAQGKEIPQGIYKDNNATLNQDVLGKGIKNICLGIGIGTFFWVLTEEAGLACIGFLVSCMGIGQVLTAYATRPKEDSSASPKERQPKHTDIEPTE